NDTGSLSEPEPVYVSRDKGGADVAEAEALFLEHLAREAIALDKVPEGLAKFAVDAKNLEDLLREKIRSAKEAEARL
ncbi:hypothetical protein H0H93_006683, partial [Arthromyces matolae]